MANIIAVLTPKGGSGKSTISIHLAVALAMKTKGKTLLVDADPGRSSLDWSSVSEGYNNLAVMGLATPTLDKELKPFLQDYDWVVIDGPGWIDKGTVGAVKIADLVIIPVVPSQFDIWGMMPLVEMIRDRQELMDGRPSYGIQINRAQNNTKSSRELAPALESADLNVFEGVISNRISFPDATGQGRTVFGYDERAEVEINRLVKQVVDAFKG